MRHRAKSEERVDVYHEPVVEEEEQALLHGGHGLPLHCLLLRLQIMDTSPVTSAQEWV